MPKLVIPLTDLKLKTAKAGSKLIKLSDGDGLYLEVMPNGAKTWRFRFRQVNGKENLLTFGPYPDVGLAEARNKRAQARQLLREGIDPARERDAQRVAATEQRAHTFERVAREWHANKRKSWSPQYAGNVLHRLEQDIFPEIGLEPIQGLPHRRIIAVLRKIEARGALEIAKRQRAVCRQIFSDAIQSGIADRNPVATGGVPTMGYTGHRNDADTGLVYMQQRYYDPLAGRFLSIDPVITDASNGSNFNRYLYANNNPYSYVDPDGKFSFFVHWGITLFAAKNAGYSLGDSVRFANRALMADFDSGAQAATKEATAIHAMRIRGEGIDEARQLNSKVVSESIASGDLGKASHAIQDRFASGHSNFTVWEGFKVLGVWGTIKHILADTFPSSNALSGSYKDTKSMFESQLKGKVPEIVGEAVNSSSGASSGNMGPQGCMAEGGNCWW